MYKTLRCVDSHDTRLRQCMTALCIFQEHVSHLWPMLGTGLSIFKLHIFIIPAMPCTINLEMLNTIKLPHHPSQCRTKRKAVVQWSELVSCSRDLRSKLYWTYMCACSYNCMPLLSSFTWNWTKMKYTFTFERQLAKIIREKVISLTLLNPPLTFSKGLEYRKREHILSMSLTIFLARLLSTKNTFKKKKTPHI